ncbi:hypothetical protein V8C42DRAFT_257229 [Trichoderma barbatum]
MYLQHLPIELLCISLSLLPDVKSLYHAILAHPLFYRAFSCSKNKITSSVLRNEIPSEIYVHALANFMVCKTDYLLPEFQSTSDLDKISTSLQELRHDCDLASKRYVSLEEAQRISKTNCKVVELCRLLLGSGTYRERQNLFPLWNAVHFPKPSHSERTRVFQAIYLFNILSVVCRDYNVVTNNTNLHQMEMFRRNLQQCIIESLMAPWEFYYAIGIRAYFRRAFYGITYVSDASRIISSVLASGLDFIHKSLCAPSSSGLEAMLHSQEASRSYERGSAFDFVVSQALCNSWLRQRKMSTTRYKPFWEGDRDSYENWKSFEQRQFAILGANPEPKDLIRHEFTLLDGYFGIWGTALWDKSRWGEIIEIIVENDLLNVLEMPDDWDPMAIGVLLVDDFFTAEE